MKVRRRALVFAVTVLVLGGMSMWILNHRESRRPARLSWYLEKLGIPADPDGQVRKDSILSALGAPRREENGTLEYEGFCVTVNSAGEAVQLLVTSAQVDILKDGVCVGDDIETFDLAYRDSKVEDHSVTLFRGPYSLQNCFGVRITCKEDPDGKIEEILLEQVVYK